MQKMFKKRIYLVNAFTCAVILGLVTTCFLKPALSEEKRLVVTPAQRGKEMPLTPAELTPTKEALKVKYINEEIPYLDLNLDKLRNALKQAEPITVKLSRQNKLIPNGGGSISQVEARGFHNGKWLYISLTWKDVTNDGRRIRPQQFADATALMFPVVRPDEMSPEKPFSPRMGKKGKMVNILIWKADWEEDLGAYAGLVGLEDEYPRYLVTHDSELEEVKDVEQSVIRRAGGLAAGNLLSQPDKGRSVEELNAEGYGTLTSQEHQDAFGNSSWQDGEWTVVIARPLKSGDPYDTQLAPGDDTFINFAVWNGSEVDRNGQKSVSLRWHPIIIEK